MTITEAISHNVWRIRRPHWSNAHVYLRLHPPPRDKFVNAHWVDLFDRSPTAGLGAPATMRFRLFDYQEDGWVAWDGPLHPADKPLTDHEEYPQEEPMPKLTRTRARQRRSRAR